jgi:hypothetical protein
MITVKTSQKKKRSRQQKKNDWFSLATVEKAAKEDSTILRRMSTVKPMSTVASSGVYFYVSTVDVTTCTEWSAYVPRYQEYRVTALKATIVPLFTGGTQFASTGLQAPILYVAEDRAGTENPAATLTAPWTIQNCKVYPFSRTDGKPWVHEMTAIDLEDQNWYPTNVTTAPTLFRILISLQNVQSVLQASTLGQLFCEYAIQFRGIT